MPPPRKVDLLPEELRKWLQEELKTRGFADYVEVTEVLNVKLADEGLELRLGKSAVHAFGREHEEFVKYQEQASAWAANWMNDNGLEEEAQRHNVLFQMITTLAFKSMQSQMTKKGEEIDPLQLARLGKMLKDLMSSSGMREKMKAEERERIARETRQQAADVIKKHGQKAGMTEETVNAVLGEILGVEL